MFVRELLAAAVRAGGTLGEDVPLPQTVQQVIEERLTGLSSAAEALIAVAAVIGERFAYDLLAKVVPASSLDTGLDEAVAQRILRSEGREGDWFAFDHALVREVVLGRLIGLRRRTLHQAVGEALLAGPAPDPETVAYHFSRAGDGRALGYLLSAMDRALALGALSQAARLGEEALARMAEEDPRRPALLLKQGVAVELGSLDKGRLFWEAAAANGDEAVATWARHMLSIWYYRQNEPQTLAFMAQVHADQERLLHNQRYQELELVLRGQRHEYPAIAHLRASALVLAGQMEEAQRVSAEIRRRIPPEQHHAAMVDVEAGIAMYTGRCREAVELYRRVSREALDRKNFRYGFLYKWNQLHAMLWAMADQPAELDRVAAETVRLEVEASERSGYWWMPEGYSSVGLYQFVFAARMLLALGESDEAERVMAPVRPFSPEASLGFERIAVMSHTIRARIYLAQSRANLARPWLEAARRHLEERGLISMSPEVELCWGLLHRLEGDDRAARAAGARSLEQAITMGDSWHVIEARRLLGELAQTPGEATAQLGIALDLARRCRFPYEEALTQLALGRICGDRAALAAAKATLEGLGIAPVTAEAKPLPDGLTEREAEIIRLVAQGLKDKEIGERLFIALKTVQAHLRNIFNKAGVSNRAALTAYAARHGLIP